MDPSSYKIHTTTRGLKYNYFISPAKDAQPTLLFLHGFPSTSRDWQHQVAFFSARGYGVIVPDLLGYGGTDKPLEVEKYGLRLMSTDIVEILDAEKYTEDSKVIAVGHDWGSALTSRLAVYYPKRFTAFGFIAVGYMPPDPNFDADEIMKTSRAQLGTDFIGYWFFFNKPGADKIIAENFDSFFSIVFPLDPKAWAEHLAPIGAIDKWIEAQTVTALPPYITEKDKEEHRDGLLKGGIGGALNWYKAMINKVTPAEDASITPDRYPVTHPVFFGAALQDFICQPGFGKHIVSQLCPNATVVDFDTDHWVQLAAPDKTNEELLKWIEGLKV